MFLGNKYFLKFLHQISLRHFGPWVSQLLEQGSEKTLCTEWVCIFNGQEEHNLQNSVPFFVFICVKHIL